MILKLTKLRSSTLYIFTAEREFSMKIIWRYTALIVQDARVQQIMRVRDENTL